MTPRSTDKFCRKMFSNRFLFASIFFIFDFIHAAFASAKKSKKNKLILIDEENCVKDVEPIEIGGPLVLQTNGSVTEQPIPQAKEPVTELFKLLLDQGDYDGIIKFGGEMSKNDFSKHLCSAMTTLDHYKKLFKHLTDHDMIPDFLVHGNQALVKKAIIEFPTCSSECYIHDDDVNKAMILCLDENRPSRVFSLLEDLRTRFVEVDRRSNEEGLDANFDSFNFNFFIDYFREKSNSSLKRFITFHGEEFQRKYPEIFLIFFIALIRFLLNNFCESDSRQFYNDLLGQSSPLMPTVPARRALPGEIHVLLQQSCIMGEWREAVAKGLKKKSPNTERHLWKVIMAKHPGEFPTKFPPSDDTLTAVLKKFKTKQELADDWTKKNIPMLLEKLETIAFILPTVVWNIIFGYATITWATTLSWDTDSTNEIIDIKDGITLEQDPQQRQVVIHNQEQFKELIDRGEYDEIIKLGDGMESSELLIYLRSSMTTLDHLKGLFRYLENRKMLLSFLVCGNAALVDEAIIEFSNPNANSYIYMKLVFIAITFFFNKGNYDRAFYILKAIRARYMKLYVGMKQSEGEAVLCKFVRHWLKFYSREENDFPIKHFLTLHREDFATRYPDIFDTFCRALVEYLRLMLPYPKAKTLLIDLVAQRSLLTPTTFTRGFLNMDSDHVNRFSFFIHAWKEAIEEGLRQDCPGGGKRLWAVMVGCFPDKFSGEYPDTDELRAKACAGVKGGCASVAKRIFNFIGWGLSLFKKPEPSHPYRDIRIKTKKEIEDEWIEKNMPKLLKHFEDITAFLPEAVMEIIYEYLTFTWIIS